MAWGYRIDLLEFKKVRLKKSKDEAAWKDYLLMELVWVEKQVEKDIRNNSAWNYRFNVVRELGHSYKEDFKYVTEKITERVTNEAAWNYFNGLAHTHPNVQPEGRN